MTAASLAVCLGLLEAGVRLLVPEGRWRYLDASADWQADPDLGWVNRPNLDVESTVLRQSVRFRTNPDGLIPAHTSRERQPDTLRVMVFGDSMVVGRAVAQDQIYTARLEEMLQARGIRVNVVNAGVQGYSTDQVLLLMQRWLPVYRPDIVLYGSTLNDFGGIELDYASAQAKPRFVLDRAGRLRLRHPKLASEARSRGGVRAWIQSFALYRVLQPGIAVLRARLFGFHERVLLGLYEEAYFQPSFADRFDWKLFGALLQSMQETAKAAGAQQFLLFAHPEVGEVWEPYIQRVCESFGIPRSRYDPLAMERRLGEVAAANGVEFEPLIEDFRARPERGPFHLLPTDGHLGPAGHELLAESLAVRLAQADWLTSNSALR